MLVIEAKYHQADRALIIELCRKVVFNDPANNCIIKGKRSDWNALPKNKSLFHTGKNIGLPIGNLTSQVFANFYMDSFDHFVKYDLGIRKKMIFKNLSGWWWNYVYLSGGIAKFVKKTKYY